MQGKRGTRKDEGIQASGSTGDRAGADGAGEQTGPGRRPAGVQRHPAADPLLAEGFGIVGLLCAMLKSVVDLARQKALERRQVGRRDRKREAPSLSIVV